MRIIKIEQIAAELLTFEDGSQKIAFNIPQSDHQPRLRISAVIELLEKLKISNFEIVARKQYTGIKRRSGRKIALYIVEAQDGLYISIHESIKPKGEMKSDQRFPSTSREFADSEESLESLFEKIQPKLEGFLNA